MINNFTYRNDKFSLWINLLLSMKNNFDRFISRDFIELQRKNFRGKKKKKREEKYFYVFLFFSFFLFFLQEYFFIE